MDSDCHLDVIASFSVVVFDWCGDLFGMWLELRVPLGVFFLTEALLPPPTLATYTLLISAIPDITTMPVKASQNQAGNLSAMIRHALFPVQPHAYTTAKFLKTIKVHKWLVFLNPVTIAKPSSS